MPATPPDKRFMAALMARRKGDAAGARARLEEILASEPDHQDALEVLGMLVSEAGELDQAIAITTRLVELAPGSIMAHANLSRFFMLKGDKETAEEWQGKARVLGWKEEVGRKSAAGGGASGLDAGVDPDMLEKQEQAVSARPDDVLARLALAASYRKLGMPAKAIGHLQKALALDGNLSTAWLDLGKCQEDAGMLGQARDTYAKGLAVAERKGDLMPRNQMASRLAGLDKKATP